MPNIKYSTNPKSTPDWLPFAAVALALSILIVLLTSIAVWQESLRTKERVESHTHNISRLLKENIGNVIAKADALIRSSAFSYHEDLVHGRFEASKFNAFLQRQLSIFPEIDNIRVIDANGILRYGSGDIAPVSVADRDYFIRTRDSVADTLIISGPVYARLSQKWVLVLSRKLTNPDGGFTGIIFANLHIDRFAGVFSEIDTGSSGTISFRNADMSQIYRTPLVAGDDNGVGNTKVSDELREMLRRQPQAGTYEATSPLDNIKRTYSYNKIDDFPLYIIVGRGLQDAREAGWANLYWLFGLGGLLLLLTVGGTWRIYKLAKQQAALQASRSSSLVLESSPAAMLLVNDLGEIVRANSAACCLFDMERTALIGSSVEERLPQRYRHAHLSHRQAFKRHPQTRKMSDGKDLLLLNSRGVEVPVQIALAPIEIDGSHHAIVVLQDQTEIKAANKELEETLARLNLATRAAEIGVWRWDFADGQLVLDDRLRHWYEVPDEVSRGGIDYTFWRSRVHPDDLQRTESRLNEARQNNLDFDDQFRIVLSDGRIRYIHSAAVIQHHGDGSAVGMIGINRDITDQRELEAKLRESNAELVQHRDNLDAVVLSRTLELAAARDQAESANRAKSAFLANMSHELRTPMNHIIGFASILKKDIVEPKGLDRLTKLQAASNRLLNLINDVLDTASLEAQQIQVESLDFQLTEMLRQVATAAEGLVSAKGLAFSCELDPSLPLVVNGDSLRIESVLSKLLDNAVKFTDQGHVILRARRLASLNDELVSVRFEVEDSGIGIDAGLRDKLFTLFDQADNSSTRQYGGMGIGLALCQRLVSLMGGEIGFDSTAGQGSVFWFVLRLSVSAAPANSASSPI